MSLYFRHSSKIVPQAFAPVGTNGSILDTANIDSFGKSCNGTNHFACGVSFSVCCSGISAYVPPPDDMSKMILKCM